MKRKDTRHSGFTTQLDQAIPTTLYGALYNVVFSI